MTRQCFCAAVLLAAVTVGQTAAAEQPRPTAQQPAPQPQALKPWPTEQELEARRREAESRQLFRGEAPLAVTITADFGAVNRDRDPGSTRTFPATIHYAPSKGAATPMPIQIRTRGHSRRLQRTCDFAPLRLEFEKARMKGTVFAGHNALKLGTHCRDSKLFEQYVLREYAVYRLFNRLTPRSFRARLATVTYVDARSKQKFTRYGLFLEDDDDVAERLKGRIVNVPGLPFRGLDADALTRFTLFEFMIGNTDFSSAAQHNVRLVQTKDGRRFPVPYDFDSSGLVHTTYSRPGKALGITSVRQRLYRGPCRTAAEFEPFFAEFRAARADLLAAYDAVPTLEAAYREEAVKYLGEFFRTIDRPGDIRRAFLADCKDRAGTD